MSVVPTYVLPFILKVIFEPSGSGLLSLSLRWTLTILFGSFALNWLSAPRTITDGVCLMTLMYPDLLDALYWSSPSKLTVALCTPKPMPTLMYAFPFSSVMPFHMESYALMQTVLFASGWLFSSHSVTWTIFVCVTK